MRKISRTALIILVVFLLGTNIAVIITYRAHLTRDLQQTEQTADIPSRQADIPPRPFGNYIASELELDDTQQAKFMEFRRLYNRSANRTVASMNVIRNRMARELNSVRPSREKLSQLAEALGEKHRDLKIITFDYYFNMLSVLNQEQSEKLATLFQSLLSAPGPGQGYGGPRHRNRDFEVNPDSIQNGIRQYQKDSLRRR